MGLHLQRVTGDRQAFKDLTYSGFGGKRFTDTGQISVVGNQVLGVFNFQMQIADNRYADPESRRMSIDYKKGPIAVDIGDIQGTVLNTNSFASFSRQMKGVSASYQAGRFAFKGVQSQAKGAATTISLQGDNSAGPYYLQNSRISRDSVQVQVDGQTMKLGQDYIVNYDIGSITFQNKIVPPTSTVVVSYEALNAGGAQGVVRGMGASYDAGKFGKFGITSLAQNPQGKQGLNQRTDLFQGFGDPSTPYTLNYQPLATQPVIVKLQGVVQTENVQYRFDPNNPAVFFFLFPVPATSNIDVTYTPKPITTVDGKRRVVGFDYTLPFGGNVSRGSVVYNQATGSLDGVSAMSGTARKLGVNYALGALQLRAEVRDIPNTFAGIQSTGFLRNERSSNISIQNGHGKWTYGGDFGKSLIGTQTVSGLGAITFQNAKTNSMRAFVNYAQTPNDTWALSHSRNFSQPATGAATKLDTTSLSKTWKAGRLNASVGYDQTRGSAPLSLALGSQVNTAIALNTMRVSTTYNPGAAWTLGANYSSSDVHAGAQSGHGNDISLNAEFRPSTKLDVQFLTSQSTSGALAVLSGLQTGFGFGYGGNGFSSGVGSGAFLSGASGNDYRSNMLAVTYQLSPKMNLATRLSTGSSSGTIAANSSSRSLSLDFDWDLGRGHQTGLSYTNSHTTFLSSAAVSNATTVDWFLNANPKGPWSYKLDTNYLLSGGDTQFGQNSFGLDLSATRKLTKNQHLGFSFHSGRTTGYLPQNEHFLQLFHEYQLYQNVALRTSYTWRKVLNSDPTLTAGAYQAHGLDIDLTFDFIP